MLGSRLIFATVLGAAVAAGGAAHAENLFEAFARGLQEAFGGQQGGAPAIAPTRSRQTAALSRGAPLYPDQVSRTRVVPSQFRKQTVRYQTGEKPGTIIIDTKSYFLYYVLENGRATRYGVGVGRTGFGWKGTVKVADKKEWPAWRPPAAMIAREAKRGHKLPTYVAGGKGNPLGARALYLYNGRGDTGYRIHGTSEPWTIGLNVSSGCIRLVNDDVIDLYNRTGVGTKVIVL